MKKLIILLLTALLLVGCADFHYSGELYDSLKSELDEAAKDFFMEHMMEAEIVYTELSGTFTDISDTLMGDYTIDNERYSFYYRKDNTFVTDLYVREVQSRICQLIGEQFDLEAGSMYCNYRYDTKIESNFVRDRKHDKPIEVEYIPNTLTISGTSYPLSQEEVDNMYEEAVNSTESKFLVNIGVDSFEEALIEKLGCFEFEKLGYRVDLEIRCGNQEDTYYSLVHDAASVQLIESKADEKGNYHDEVIGSMNYEDFS